MKRGRANVLAQYQIPHGATKGEVHSIKKSRADSNVDYPSSNSQKKVAILSQRYLFQSHQTLNLTPLWLFQGRKDDPPGHHLGPGHAATDTVDGDTRAWPDITARPTVIPSPSRPVEVIKGTRDKTTMARMKDSEGQMRS